MHRREETLRPRVLLIDLGGHFGGVENYLAHLSTLIGEQVTLYALCALPSLGMTLSARGVRVLRIPLFPGVLKPLRFLCACFVLPLLLLRHRIDAVQLNGFLESILILPARLLGRGAVYTRHGPFELDRYTWWRNPLKFLPRKAAQWNVRMATHVVCVSHAVAESVRPLLPAARFSIIPNWVSLSSEVPPEQKNSSSGVAVLCASRLEQYKGIHLLIEAARRMPALQVTIAGEGSYRAALEELARGAQNIRFIGFERDLEPFYAQADMVVMPSMGPEGLPMSSLEAMAHGCACILSDIPVHREITDDGKGAYLFRSGDAESLYEGLCRLAADALLRQALARQAMSIVAERYTADAVRAAYLGVFVRGRAR
jgi:glycosyltransferase involved in cell wall biosynthesis